ncbi:MAG: hypothetical protein WCB68_17970 [Pyrinomonadaceae bacterium]
MRERGGAVKAMARLQTQSAASRGKALLLSLMLLTAFSSCTSRPVEEVVTTDANRASALPPGAEPIAIAPDLPARDENIEAAGDHIAEAITYLNTRRRDRREKALGALNQAEASMNKALRARPHDDQARTALRGVLKDLDAAQRVVQRGVSDQTVTRQLATLNKDIDNLQLLPVSDQQADETETSSTEKSQEKNESQ